MRPLHETCSATADEDSPELARLCTACADAEDRKNAPAKRRRLDLSEKVRALDMLERGATPQEVASEFGASKRAIMRMRKEAHVIRSLSESGARGSMKSRKQCHPGKYAALETKVMEDLNASHSSKLPHECNVIRSCAKKVRDDMLKGTSLAAGESKDLQGFVPTDLWIKSFARRNNLDVCGGTWQMAGVSSEERVYPDIQNIKNDLQRYDPDCILSVHEATLYYKVLPRSTYQLFRTGAAGASSTGVTSGMQTKDRLTLFFCTNATGTLKVPLAVVGTSKQPLCFRVKRCPLEYFAQENALVDAVTFKEWFSQVLLPAVRQHSWKNVALLVESISDEKIVEDSRSQVKVFRLPPDPGSKRYPMEKGIMEAVKQKYRYTMLERVVELISVRDAVQGCPEKRDVGFLGLVDGHDANELDATEILCSIWEGTSAQSIARSWVKSGILPDGYNAAMVARHGNSQAFGKSDILFETCTVRERETIDRMNMLIRSRSLRTRDGSSDAVVELVNSINSMNEQDLETWLALEEKPDIRSALRREAEKSMSASAQRNRASHANGQVAVQQHNESIQLQALPSLSEISELFVPLEDLVSVCDGSEAAFHLREAKRILFTAKLTEEGSAAYHSSRMTTFTAPFPP